jgi:hypothetical protein
VGLCHLPTQQDQRPEKAIPILAVQAPTVFGGKFEVKIATTSGKRKGKLNDLT